MQSELENLKAKLGEQEQKIIQQEIAQTTLEKEKDELILNFSENVTNLEKEKSTLEIEKEMLVQDLN